MEKKTLKFKKTLKKDAPLASPTLPGTVRKTRVENATIQIDEMVQRSLATTPPDQMGEDLVAQGLITRHQLFNALNHSYQSGRPLKEALVSLGYLDAGQVLGMEEGGAKEEKSGESGETNKTNKTSKIDKKD
jgi:hypothetical protein